MIFNCMCCSKFEYFLVSTDFVKTVVIVLKCHIKIFLMYVYLICRFCSALWISSGHLS